MIDNNKLAKELSAIYASSNKAKKSVVAEIAKVDEKYRKLAEQEKTELNKTLEMLDVQLKYYGTLLGFGKEEEKAEESKEEVIEDTIFPENNEEIAKNEEKDSEEAAEKTGEDLDAEDDADWEKKIESGELTKVEWPEPAEEAEALEKTEAPEDDWPDYPQEWK